MISTATGGGCTDSCYHITADHHCPLLPARPASCEALQHSYKATFHVIWLSGSNSSLIMFTNSSN